MNNIYDKSTPFRYLYKGEGEEGNRSATDKKTPEMYGRGPRTSMTTVPAPKRFDFLGRWYKPSSVNQGK